MSSDYYKIHDIMQDTLVFAKHLSSQVANSTLFHKEK